MSGANSTPCRAELEEQELREILGAKVELAQGFAGSGKQWSSGSTAAQTSAQQWRGGAMWLQERGGGGMVKWVRRVCGGAN